MSIEKAVQAGAKALKQKHAGPRDEAQAALDAMLPHLRQMIAQEIADYWLDLSTRSEYSRGYCNGLLEAAEIVRGQANDY